MSAYETLAKAIDLVSVQNRRPLFTLLGPYFNPEMLAASVNYLERFNVPALTPKEIADKIFELIAEASGLEDFRQSTTKQTPYAHTRQLAMYVLYTEIPEFSYQQVGNLFTKGFGHATVLHACYATEERYSCEKSTRDRLNRLTASLANHGMFATREKLDKIEIII